MKTRNILYTAILLTLVMFLGTAQAATLEWQCSVTNVIVKNNKPETMRLVFNFDPVTKEAFMKGNNGMTEVVAIAREDGTAATFLEITPSGNVMTTTVTYQGNAVMSRNYASPSNFAPSQYVGTCKDNIWNKNLPKK